MTALAEPQAEPQADPTGLKELLRPVLERYEAQVAERQEHLEGLARTEMTIIEFHSVLLSAGFDVSLPAGMKQDGPPKPGPGKKKSYARGPRPPVTRANGTSTGFGISMEAASGMAQAVIKLVDERQAEAGPGVDVYVSQKEIYLAVGSDQSKGSAAFKWFRHIGFLGKAGRDPSSTRERWRLMDRDAVEKELQAASDASDRDFEQAAAGDPSSRAAAYIEAEGQVVGWNTVGRACDIPHASMNRIKVRLLERDLIEVSGKPGAPATITWKGNTNGSK